MLARKSGIKTVTHIKKLHNFSIIILQNQNKCNLKLILENFGKRILHFVRIKS